jgi:hypothetical protein
MFPPTHPDVLAHHVTDVFGVDEEFPLPTATSGVVVGMADDERVQALVIEIDGDTERADGKTYHCTWSLNREAGAKPKMSNNVIATHGWRMIPRIRVALVPARFDC